MTPVGRVLRRYGLDELPQLLNILGGSMALVGPRPGIPAAVGRQRPALRHSVVKPGITGLWQISGSNDVTYRRRVAMDVAYSRSMSLRLNLRIMVMTVPCVLFARGSY